MKNLSSPKPHRGRYTIKLPPHVAKELSKMSQDDYHQRCKQARLHIEPFDLLKHDVTDESDSNQPQELSVTRMILSCLTDKERQILLLRNGFIKDIPYTLVEVGLLLGEGRERIRQIEAKALEKIRQDRVAVRILRSIKSP